MTPLLRAGEGEGWVPPQTKHLSTHTVPSSWPVPCLLLDAKGFWIHPYTHRCWWCQEHDAK